MESAGTGWCRDVVRIERFVVVQRGEVAGVLTGDANAIR